jgi:DNA-binding SARP family transcriptional activator/tetratricopeptide (TPR) repeat protein
VALDVEVRLLGPVEVWVGERRLSLGPRKQRLVLAVLALESNRVVPVERLIEVLWPDRPPASARGAVQVCVSRLRTLLAEAGAAAPATPVALVSQPGGYSLRVEPALVDAHRFRLLVEQAAAGPDEVAARLLRSALALWRGEPLLGTATGEIGRRLGQPLAEARLGALDRRMDADLRLGRHREIVDELVAVVAEHPLRERFAAQLMLALYRCGQPSRALEVYRTSRRRLVDELGLEPAAELQELHEAVLRTDPALDLVPAPAASAPAPAPEPRQLPADVATFVGREAELAELDGLLLSGAPPPVAVVTGSAGMGKTALALRWAHRNVGRFPDGQLYVNLRGHSTDPALTAAEALAALLGGLGTAPESVPLAEGEQAGLYRSLLAGRRLLVLLDNAASPAQVRPLLPGSATCTVIVTSRNDLRGLTALGDARRLTLDVLPEPDALALLDRVLGGGRVGAEPAAAAELVALSARLPLALRIAAAQLTGRHHGTFAGYAAELRAGNRLAALAVLGDDQAAIRAAFELSYAALPMPARRLFRLLGLVPGPDVTAAAAAALAGAGLADATGWLDQLTSAHLVDQHEPGRFSFHDLLRLYALELARAHDPEPDRRDALRRLIDGHYLVTVDAAARLLYPHVLRLPDAPVGAPPPPASLPPPASRPPPASPAPPATPGVPERAAEFVAASAASDWLDRELPNLLAAILAAAEQELPRSAWLLADSLRGYFWLRCEPLGWLAVARCALAAADSAGDRPAQAAAYLSLGALDSRQDRPRQAIDGYTHALRLARETGWRHAQAAALGNLGSVYHDIGEMDLAADHLASALELNRQLGLVEGQAVNLAHLGWLYADLGRLEEAAAQFRAALELDRQTGSRSGEAVDLTNLGEVYHKLGHLDAAQDCVTQGLTLHRAIGDRGSEADALASLAAVHAEAGRYAEALRLARKALADVRAEGHLEYEANALHALAGICVLVDDHRQAVDLYQEALRLGPGGSLRRKVPRTLVGLATAYQRLGAADAATAHAVRGLRLARRYGYQVDAGLALTCLAEIRLAAGEPAAAIDYAGQALAVHAETGNLLGSARTHLVLGHALRATGATDRAERHWTQSLALYTRSGSAGARQVAGLLRRVPPDRQPADPPTPGRPTPRRSRH